MASATCSGKLDKDENKSHLRLLVTFERLIEDCLYPTHILASMPSMREFAAEIRKREQHSRKEAVQMFLRLLKDQSTSGVKGWYQEFINALQENGFEIIYKSLKGFGDVKDQEAYKTLLTMHYEALTKVRPADLMPYLIQTEALDTHDAEMIDKCCRNESIRSAMIVMLDLLSKKKESWFQNLIYALKKGGWEELGAAIIPEIAKTRGDESSVKKTVDRFIQSNRNLRSSSIETPQAIKSSTSQKHRNVVAEPIGKKQAKKLPGTGDVLGQKTQTIRSSTSQKHRSCVAEPMGEKQAKKLPGIGNVLGQKPPPIMSSTSKKHRDFVTEPMGEKQATELPGIGDVIGRELKKKKFGKAHEVYGQYLVLKKNEQLFVEWLKNKAGANTKQSKDCFQCLQEWCETFS